MGMAIMWRICTVSGIQYLLHFKPLGEMIAERFGVHGLTKVGVMLTFFAILVDLDCSRI